MKTKAILAATCLACVSARAYVADVTKYGAKGDGVTDDTAAVQRAIDLGRGGFARNAT